MTNSKYLYLVLTVAVLAIFGGVEYFAWKNQTLQDITSTHPSSTQTSPAAKTEPSTSVENQTKKAFVFVTDEVSSSSGGNVKWRVIQYNLSDKKISEKTYSSQNHLVPLRRSANGLGDPVQWNEDGTIMAYSYGEEEGLGPKQALKTYKLIVEQGGKTTVILENLEPEEIKKWTLLPNGKSIVYIKKSNDAGGPSLYLYDLTLKTHSRLIENLKWPDFGNLFVFDNNLIVVPRVEGDKKIHILTYSLQDQKNLDKQIFSGQFSYFTSAIEVSPATKATLELSSEFQGEKCKLQILDIENGALSDLVEVGAQECVGFPEWSQYNKTLAYILSFTDKYGDQVNANRNELWVMDYETKNKLIVDKNLKKDGGLQPLKWSRDEQYLAYLKGSEIHLYNYNDNKSEIIYTIGDGNLVASTWLNN